MKAVKYFICFSSAAFIIFNLTAYDSDRVPVYFLNAISLVGIAFLMVLITLAVDKIKRTRYSSWTGILLMTSILAFALGFLILQFQNTKRKANANMLISKLKDFNKDTGEYPHSLSELEPKYFDKVPTSNWGLHAVPFDYRKEIDRNEFSIKYNISSESGYWYHSSNNEWDFYD